MFADQCFPSPPPPRRNLTIWLRKSIKKTSQVNHSPRALPFHFPSELPAPVLPPSWITNLSGPPSTVSAPNAVSLALVKSACCCSLSSIQLSPYFLHQPLCFLHQRLASVLHRHPPPWCPQGPRGPSQSLPFCVFISVLQLDLSSMGTYILKKKAMSQSQQLPCVPSFLITVLCFFKKMSSSGCGRSFWFIKSKRGKTNSSV